MCDLTFLSSKKFGKQETYDVILINKSYLDLVWYKIQKLVNEKKVKYVFE